MKRQFTEWRKGIYRKTNDFWKDKWALRRTGGRFDSSVKMSILMKIPHELRTYILLLDKVVYRYPLYPVA